MNRPESFQDLLQRLRDGNPITVEMSANFSRTLFYENGDYFEQTPEGRKQISRRIALAHLRVLFARIDDERREQQQRKG